MRKRLLCCNSYQNPSQNLKKNIFKRSGKFLKNAGISTETVALAVLPSFKIVVAFKVLRPAYSQGCGKR
ncbi:hypothetical protein LEP1GSC016_1958 [Leptospira borgpetersenii serovar Hardjo-bovis str. Sponselee]|uniref:Uncharacterized protein n=1 Tax=Leptospira borgpetersenii serovar Hardjo-bovis str. Sponselee TaxID=1303729 RepID=M6BX91_LEPBO|nr:hypothetical protein [Leptospira borgpetersenii]AMX59016.1 hypothetical protein LBK6_11915 [Leptospira borgpetersenii serovar Hardjo]AMX65511.1 hypothetical protein LBK30_11975 [Leptospira borgpetersenii serovar Hardjo]AMX68721.1 hypothetical protein LBHA_11805 [Leptospira borgpetersenii serovar Hardjo]AWV70789.1 hypothetical protein B9T54_12850 [Leptospira borgpetersenii serovar Hardjo-bovis]AYR09205.1 hypothetical protein D1609_12790 [Leptospira borgpetersenii serovar Hardjo-bovis]